MQSDQERLTLARAGHEEKLGNELWRTLNRLEYSIADRRIDLAQAQEVLRIISEFLHALEGRKGARKFQPRSSRIHPRTHGSNA